MILDTIGTLLVYHYFEHHFDWEFDSPTVLFTLVLGMLFPSALFTFRLGILFNTYFGKPFPPVGFCVTNTEGGFLGTLPC